MKEPFLQAPESFQIQQERLAKQVQIPAQGGYCPAPGAVIMALDIQYQGDQAHMAADLMAWPDQHIGTYASVITATVPYIPTFFCFREGPPLLALIKRLSQQGIPQPELLVVDGHGIAHPRRFGLACWLGVTVGLPTIGCAKESLLHYQAQLADPRGSKWAVRLNDVPVGYLLRRQDGIRPVYVSPGHQVSLANAARIILELPGPFRIPDPLRRADHAARAHCKGIQEKEWQAIAI